MDPTEFSEHWSAFGHVSNPLFGFFENKQGEVSKETSQGNNKMKQNRKNELIKNESVVKRKSATFLSFFQ